MVFIVVRVFSYCFLFPAGGGLPKRPLRFRFVYVAKIMALMCHIRSHQSQQSLKLKEIRQPPKNSVTDQQSNEFIHLRTNRYNTLQNVPTKHNKSEQINWLARSLRYGRDSNPRPPAWQAGILTSWTTTPFVIVALCDFSHLRCKITTHFPYLQYPSQKIDKKISFSALKIIFCATFTPLSLKY